MENLITTTRTTTTTRTQAPVLAFLHPFPSLLPDTESPTKGATLVFLHFPYLPFPFPPLPSPLSFLRSPFSSLPLDIGPLNTARVLRESCKLPQRGWGGALAEIDFDAF